MRTASALVLLVVLTASAAAQSNDDVTVNPIGGQVLIDPGTGQTRVVPALLQPWQAEPIKLHPPYKHRVNTAPDAAGAPAPLATAAPPPPVEAAAPPTRKHHAQRAPEATPTPEPLATAETSAPAPVVRKPRPTPRVAVVPPAPKPQTPPPQQVAPSSDVDALLSRSQTNVLASPPAPGRAAEPPAKPAKTRTASIERPSATAGKRRDSITFMAGATDPSTTAVASVRSLAGSLNSALTDSASRIQLLAYAGAKGEKSSDTRRLSLKRALVIRQLLIDDGVPSERIDVFALGGVDDDGPLDRVDVYVKG